MPRRDLTIHACEAGGFMVYGPEDDAQAYMNNRPMQPLAAFSHLREALGFVEDQMTPPRDPPPADTGGITRS